MVVGLVAAIDVTGAAVWVGCGDAVVVARDRRRCCGT